MDAHGNVETNFLALGDIPPNTRFKSAVTKDDILFKNEKGGICLELYTPHGVVCCPLDSYIEDDWGPFVETRRPPEIHTSPRNQTISPTVDRSVP